MRHPLSAALLRPLFMTVPSNTRTLVCRAQSAFISLIPPQSFHPFFFFHGSERARHLQQLSPVLQKCVETGTRCAENRGELWVFCSCWRCFEAIGIFSKLFSPSLSSPFFALSALPSLHCRFVFFILQVVLHVCDASSWFFLQCVSLNILISMLSAGFLLISALFEAVLFVLHAFFSMIICRSVPYKPQFFSPCELALLNNLIWAWPKKNLLLLNL